MAWSEATARARINEFIAGVPAVDVQRFESYLSRYRLDKALRESLSEPVTPPLFSLRRGKAVVVDTVQIYIAITNYDDYRLEEGRETEASHERAMRLLHLYYSAADRTIETSAAQRVDFHGGRMHAVVLETGSHGVTRETLAQALAFIDDFRQVAEAANRELARNEFKVSFRVGIDIGTCVAINNGTGCEQEPLFLGGAANHAAKLAFGKEPGVYLSDNARRLLGLTQIGVIAEFLGISDAELAKSAARRDTQDKLVFGDQNRADHIGRLLSEWREDIRRGDLPDLTMPTFSFSHREPPLRTIDYSELKPSRSIRMSLVSMYADLCGYTDYIDRAVASGTISDAVRALYVIREEFQSVVEKDFGGRKVRFIGDCIHAIVAEGTRYETDERKSVVTSALCAGALHSSFTLCKDILGGLDSLGLAVGLELGPTPVSRIGIRGDRSVRVASSIATARSEQMQRDCADNGVKFGPRARKFAPVAIEDVVDRSGYTKAIDYAEIAVCLSAVPVVAASPVYARAHVPSVIPQPRAHLRLE